MRVVFSKSNHTNNKNNRNQICRKCNKKPLVIRRLKHDASTKNKMLFTLLARVNVFPYRIILCSRTLLFSFFFYLVRCPTSYQRAQNTRRQCYMTRAILNIASLAAHTTLNTYKPLEINIERSPQH